MCTLSVDKLYHYQVGHKSIQHTSCGWILHTTWVNRPISPISPISVGGIPKAQIADLWNHHCVVSQGTQKELEYASELFILYVVCEKGGRWNGGKPPPAPVQGSHALKTCVTGLMPLVTVAMKDWIVAVPRLRWGSIPFAPWFICSHGNIGGGSKGCKEM